MYALLVLKSSLQSENVTDRMQHIVALIINCSLNRHVEYVQQIYKNDIYVYINIYIQDRKIIENEKRCRNGSAPTRKDIKVKVNIQSLIHPYIFLQ